MLNVWLINKSFLIEFERFSVSEFSLYLAGLFLPISAYANDQNVNNDVRKDPPIIDGWFCCVLVISCVILFEQAL